MVAADARRATVFALSLSHEHVAPRGTCLAVCGQLDLVTLSRMGNDVRKRLRWVQLLHELKNCTEVLLEVRHLQTYSAQVRRAILISALVRGPFGAERGPPCSAS